MTTSPRHSQRCEQAVKPKCVCSSCGGSAHGWSGHIERARRGDAGVRELRDPAEREWWEQSRKFRENHRRAPTKYLRQAGGRVAVAALVAWLSENPGSVDRVERIGRRLNEQVFDKDLRVLVQERSGDDPALAEYGKEMAGHFWCDLLAEIADFLDHGADLLDKAPEGLKDAVLEHEDAAHWGPVRARLAEATLGFVWKGLQLILGADLGAAVLHVRVLAVLICPDPGAHLRVAQCCLRPLVKDALQDHLTTNLEPDWLWSDGR